MLIYWHRDDSKTSTLCTGQIAAFPNIFSIGLMPAENDPADGRPRFAGRIGVEAKGAGIVLPVKEKSRWNYPAAWSGNTISRISFGI
jgi:hypothetical protein